MIGTRFGTVWSLRLAAFAALGTLIALSALDSERRGCGRPGSAGRGRWQPSSASRRRLAGHASTVDPSALLVPANFVHVSAMSVWVGGVATLLLAVPAATRRLDPRERTPLLAATVARFSTVAILAVAALVGSGIAQAIPELESLSDFTRPRSAARCCRRSCCCSCCSRSVRGTGSALAPGSPGSPNGTSRPGETGALLRRSLRAEALLMVAVLGVAAALVSYPPPSSARRPVRRHRSTSDPPAWS